MSSQDGILEEGPHRLWWSRRQPRNLWWGLSRSLGSTGCTFVVKALAFAASRPRWANSMYIRLPSCDGMDFCFPFLGDVIAIL